MKSAFTIIKILFLVLLLISMGFGYLFFRVWQKNERPELVEASWSKEEVALGGSSTLKVTLRAPWHREITTADPISHPDSFLPVTQKTTFKKGALGLDGYRSWELRVPMVATSPQLEEGQTLTLPVKRTKRVSPNGVTVPLPPLTVISPTELPRDPENPNQFLVPEPPAPGPEETEEIIASSGPPWLLIGLGIIIVIVLLYLILRRAAKIAARPPWERALSKLEAIDTNQSSTAVFAKLTDILKQYTSERFSIPASAKTSSEFLSVVKTLGDIPQEQLEELPWLARIADAAKFAGKMPPEGSSPRALNLVRSFVENTTPQETTDA